MKKLASTCSFGSFLDEALRDRLVSGLHSKMARAQRQLLTVRDLTFSAAKERCSADEMAVKASQDHMGAVSSEDTNRLAVYKGNPGRGGSRPRPTKAAQEAGNVEPCKCCGGKHPSEECKFKNATCYGCRKTGHLRSVCRSVNRKFNSQSKVHSVQSDSQDMHGHMPESEVSVEAADLSEAAFGLYNVDSRPIGRLTSVPYKVQVKIKDKTLVMELDTGASRSTVSENIYKKLLNSYPLYDCKIQLHSYAGMRVPVLGCVKVPVSYENNPEQWLELVVVKGMLPSLFGRDWLSVIKLNWNLIFHVTDSEKNKLNIPKSDAYPKEFIDLLEVHKDLFFSVNTGIKEFRATINLKPGAKPVYRKSRPVPYSMLSDVHNEYDRLINSDILFPVNSSQWASPTVHIPKASGSIRVCGDYKEINELIEDDGYKLPNCQDLFARLAESGSPPKLYSVIDLSEAFNQVSLDKESAKLLALNTCKGLLGTKRLCFGIKTAPAQFQAIMDKILAGIDNVFIYFDDILLSTSSQEEHLKTLSLVFERFEKYNVKVNGAKCQFYKDNVEYLGHNLSSEGIRPLSNKVDGILNAHTLASVSELKSFLGMLNNYGKFLPNLSS